MGAAPAKSEGGAASSELSQAAARLLGAGDVKPARKRTPAPASRGGGSDPKKR
jgi:hypothetical protein